MKITRERTEAALHAISATVPEHAFGCAAELGVSFEREAFEGAYDYRHRVGLSVRAVAVEYLTELLHKIPE